MALFLFAFLHANILLDEISLDWIAIFHGHLGLRMIFILLILLEGDLSLRDLLFVIALLECWFLTLIFIYLCLKCNLLLLLLLLSTAIMRLILFLLGLIFSVLALAWARLPGFPTLLIMRRPF
jgi:hypothetical protein